MKIFLKKQLAWLSIILMLSSISLSLANQPETDVKQSLGQPAGTAGHKQNEESEKPLGTRGLHLSNQPKSDAGQALGKPAGTAGHKQNEESVKPLGTRGHH